jgi:hypothetical protein
MVKIELYVPGLKRKDMTDIAYLDIVEGSRGIRYRAYGTHTDPNTNKIHKVNSFIPKDVYDKTMAEMTVGMPIDDMIVERVEVVYDEKGNRTCECPLDSMVDECCVIDWREFNADNLHNAISNLSRIGYLEFCAEFRIGGEDAQEMGWFIADKYRDMDVWKWLEEHGHKSNAAWAKELGAESFGAEGGSFEAVPSELGGPTEPDNAGVPADVGGDEPVPMGDEPTDINFGADTVGESDYEGRVIFCDDDGKGSACDESYCHRCNPIEGCTDHDKCQEIGRFAAEEADLTGIIVQDNDPSSPPDGIFASDDRVTRPEAFDKVYNAIDVIKSNNLKVTLQAVGNELHDDGYMTNDEKEAFYYIIGQKNLDLMGLSLNAEDFEAQGTCVCGVNCVCECGCAETGVCNCGDACPCDCGCGVTDAEDDSPVIIDEEVEERVRPESGTWAAIALDMALAGDMTPEEANHWKDEMKEKGFDAEMTLREWGESELEEPKHDFSENPNESFREWIDEEVKAHGDVSFKDWADEEEHDEPTTVTKSAETDNNRETQNTQIAVALGIPPDIWLNMSINRQNEYITSMELDVMQIREWAQLGEFQLIMDLANNQKEVSTAGDLSLIECNVCGISAAQLLEGLGGVCDITDPNGGANPDYLRGVSCPFEKYYSLTRAVYNAVEDELKENRTVIQLITPRSVAYAAESNNSAKPSNLSHIMNRFKGQKLSFHSHGETLMNISKDTSLGDFTSKELTESSAIQGDFDHASLNYSGHQNLEARAEDTFKSDSWDDLYVVAEGQIDNWEACDVTDGVLQTYSNQSDAEREAQMTIDDLNSMYDWDSNPMRLEEGQVNYEEGSWAGKRLSEVSIGSNVEFIEYPNGLKAPYPPGRSSNTGYHLEATRGIDTFTEPFEEEEEAEPVKWGQVVGIGAAAFAAYLIAKRL